MSKVTDRLDNKQIIDLAKKNYETKQRTSKFPGHVVKLPSAGKVYPASSPLRDGTIELRLMTAYDEDILTNSSYITEGITFDKLLEALIITPDVHIDDIINSDKEALLISARILGYGAEYVTTIDKDGNQEEHTLDLNKIEFKPFDLESDENGEFIYTVPTTRDVIKYRYLTSAEARKITDDMMISQFLKMSVMQVNDSRNSVDIENFLTYEFRAGDSKNLRMYIIKNQPGIQDTIQVEGDDGSTFNTGFRLKPDLFWF
jgi:hypothetical protein